jgi:hypothetical protein
MVPADCSRDLHALNPARTIHWEVAGAGHTECLAREPTEYARRVVGFLSRHVEARSLSRGSPA